MLGNDNVAKLIVNMNNVIINPIITLLFGLAILVFIWGLVEFFWVKAAGKKGEGGGLDISRAKSHMIWGIIGLFIMVAAVSIIRVTLATFGIDVAPLDAINNPNLK